MAFFRRGHVHVNALALIGMTLSVARSPLNQAAAGVSNGLVIRNGTLDLHVAREIPDYYLATIGSSRLSGIARASALTQRFSTTMREYSARSPMKLEHDDCGDTCDLVLNTFGFCATCSSKTTSLSPRLETEPNESEPLFSIASDYWIQGNPYNSSVSNPTYANLILSILYVTGVAAEVGNVTRVNQTCYLQPSVMAAPARLTRNNEIILNEHWGGDECVRPLNYTVPMAGWSPPPTTIGGFQYVLDDLYKSSASFTNKGSTESIDFYRIIGNQYVANDTQRYPTFLDPTDDVLDALREISFRTSLHAAVQSTAKSDSAATSIQTVPFKGSAMHAVYQTNRGAMAGGFVLAVIGIACVSLLYVRYWELGREMSMSPLEIARAFDAPLLRGVDGNAEVEDIVQDVGKSYVRYGEVTDGPRGQDSLRRLRFEDASLVERPEEGKTYY